jgi:phage shock protein A
MAATTRRKASRKADDFVSRLAEAGEEALQRIAELPGGQKAVSAFNDLRNRVDELSRRVRGIEELEARVAKLEKEVAALKRTKAAPRRTSASRSRTTPSSS